MEIKTCSKCGVNQSIMNFNVYSFKDNSYVRGVCKGCNARSDAERWRLTNNEKRKVIYEKHKRMTFYKKRLQEGRLKTIENRKKRIITKVCVVCGQEYSIIKSANNKTYCENYECKKKFYYNKGKKTKYRMDNREYINKWYRENYDRYKQKKSVHSKIYYQKIKPQRCKQYKEKYKSNILFNLQERCKKRILLFIKMKGYKKPTDTYHLIGCSWTSLKMHLENKFKDGMSWGNMGKWHIDHIIPLSIAKTEEDVYKLCHYTNLQPLWAKDNLIKNKYVKKLS